MPSDLARCVVHPARRAADRCPMCARPRCAVDSAQWADRGCPACPPTRRGRSVGSGWEVPVRAGLAGAAVALAGGFVSTEYVGTHYLSVVVPALVGVAASWAVPAAAGTASAGRRAPQRVVSVVAAVLGTALGFRLVPGGQSLLTPVGDVAPPYAAAAAGALVWPLLFGAPSPRASWPTRRWSRGQPGRGSDA